MGFSYNFSSLGDLLAMNWFTGDQFAGELTTESMSGAAYFHLAITMTRHFVLFTLAVFFLFIYVETPYPLGGMHWKMLPAYCHG